MPLSDGDSHNRNVFWTPLDLAHLSQGPSKKLAVHLQNISLLHAIMEMEGLPEKRSTAIRRGPRCYQLPPDPYAHLRAIPPQAGIAGVVPARKIMEVLHPLKRVEDRAKEAENLKVQPDTF